MTPSNDEEEDTGPSVESSDPEERILARRLRIQKRIEQQKREALGENTVAKKETINDMGKGKVQVEVSRKRLDKLKSDGMELVTNVRVAGDAREMQHRLEDTENRHVRLEKLEAEAKTSQEKFNDISRRWTAASTKEIPSDLHTLLVEQTQSCEAVMEEKNKLINVLQLELKQKDDDYVKDLKKQSEDVDLMIERMEEQVRNLTKSFRDELIQIEQAFVDERGDSLRGNRKKWDSSMKQRRDREEEYLRMRFKRVDDNESQLDSLRTQDTEEYNMIKIKLETDVQILEQQLQQMKATYQLNQEKLEYNFQVLKKRDEENTITKSQQKRKITRMQDALNNLRQKLTKQERHYIDENQSLVDEYKRITDQHKQLHKKMKHFSANDLRKFKDIWKMNEEEVRGLVEKVLEADQVIHEQQLGLHWNRPQLAFMKTKGGPLELQASDPRPKATDFAKEILQASSAVLQRPLSQVDEDGDTETDQSIGQPKLSLGAVKRILEVLCDEAGFLVEEKLNKLLQPLENDERSLIKLDAIFKALNIETEEDITKLTKLFYQYEKHLPKTKMSTEESFGTFSELDESLHSCGFASAASDPDASRRLSLGNDVYVHPNHVLKVLKRFVDEHIKASRETLPSDVTQYRRGLAARDVTMDDAFWDEMADVIDERKLKLWDALVEALNKYYHVLCEREKRIKETDSLRQQNGELRMLLHQYISSKVNQELEIPPTRVLQLEYN